MRAVNFISRRFNSARTMPRSVRIMRSVAGIGVAVAVVAMVLAQSIGNGFERVYRRSLLDFNAHVVILGAGEIEDPSEALDQLSQLIYADDGERDLARGWSWVARAGLWIEDSMERLGLDPSVAVSVLPGPARERYAEVRRAAGKGLTSMNIFLYREALAIGGGGIKGVVVKGIEPGRAGSTGGMDIEPFEGAAAMGEAGRGSRGGEVGVILGRSLASSMDIAGAGRSVRMMIPREGAAGFQEGFEDVTPIGTFESGMYDYDSQFMLMDVDDLRRLFGVGGSMVTGIELRLDDPDRAQLMAQRAEELLGPRYRAVTWQELNSELLAAVKLEKLVTSLIMGIMLLVAALNIIAALVLTMLRRTKEIAVLKALGFNEGRIQRLFIRGGMGVGMRGVLAGLAVGLAAALIIKEFKLIPLSAEIYLVDSLPIDISLLICGIITLFCAAAIYLTSRIASARLAKVPPAEGLAQAR